MFSEIGHAVFWLLGAGLLAGSGSKRNRELTARVLLLALWTLLNVALVIWNQLQLLVVQIQEWAVITWGNQQNQLALIRVGVTLLISAAGVLIIVLVWLRDRGSQINIWELGRFPGGTALLFTPRLGIRQLQQLYISRLQSIRVRAAGSLHTASPPRLCYILK
jgi:hypothetical protein